MNVNFIITAFGYIEYAPILRRVLMNYRIIQPEVLICYNGPVTEFECNIRMANRGHQKGDLDLTLAGYNAFQQRNNWQRFIKTGIDTFLLDEQKLVDIFVEMERRECAYAGNRWDNEKSNTYATDIIFLDTAFGCPFDGDWNQRAPSFEGQMWENMVSRQLKAHIIPQRVPVHFDNRLQCEALRWTMQHELYKNVDNMHRWGYGHLVL